MVERVDLGEAVLYRGDCRDILPDLTSATVVLTDPVSPNCPAGLLPGSEGPLGLWRDAMTVPPPVGRLVTVLRCDSDPRFLMPVPETMAFFRSIQLPYVLSSFLGRVLRGDETAYWFGQPLPPAPGRKVVPGRAPHIHPTDRPANGHPCSRAISTGWSTGVPTAPMSCVAHSWDRAPRGLPA